MKYLLLILCLSSCAITENYKFGDISHRYCSSTDLYEKAQLKVLITNVGITVGVDYCLKVGLIDALVSKPE